MRLDHHRNLWTCAWWKCKGRPKFPHHLFANKHWHHECLEEYYDSIDFQGGRYI